MKAFTSCPRVKLCRKQKATISTMKKWNKNVFGFCQTRIDELTKLINEIQGQDVSVINAKKEAKLQRELNEWLNCNDIVWKQKSREIWLRDDDQNTKFFHLSTIIRRRHNSIEAITNDSGGWILDKKDIGHHVRDKFNSLFTEEGIPCPPDLCNLMPPIISSEVNEEICKIPTADEIKRVIFDM